MRFLFPIIIIIIISIVISGCNQSQSNVSLREEKVASIDFKSSGCFSERAELIDVSNKGDTMFAKLKQGKSQWRITLNTDQVNTFKRFIAQLISLHEGGGCTTVDVYKVFYNGQTINKTDGSCDWKGFDSLKHSFFKDY